MANDFRDLVVPAGNGDGAAVSFVNTIARSVSVVGAFAGLLIVEGSVDGVEWVPLATFQNPGFATIPGPFPEMRVTRRAISVNDTAGSPVVTVGTKVVLVGAETLAAPVTLNGAGAAATVDAFQITNLSCAGPFPNTGTVIHFEISVDGTAWAPIASFTEPGTQEVSWCARYARQRIEGRTAASPLPTVAVCGPATAICYEELTMPVLNGNGDSINTAECGYDKTVTIASPTRDVPGRIAIQGSNDDGTTWVTVMSKNVPGAWKLGAVFQLMRVNVSGFDAAVAGLTVGVAAPEEDCDPPAVGDPITEVTDDFVSELTITTPGALEGDLLIAAIAITFAPSLGTSPVAPGAVAVITPPAGWTTVLADYPGGDNSMGDLGDGEEQDRFAVFARVVEDPEPVDHTFTWPGADGDVCAVGTIIPFNAVIPGFTPTVHVAPTSVTILPNGANPTTVRANGVTPLEEEIMVSFFVARNGAEPGAGGSTFSTPGGMNDFSTPINARTTAAGTDPLGLAAFWETVSLLPTNVRESDVTQNNAPPNLFQGMGYSIMIAGCHLPDPPPDPGPG
jgi:hypothetical protein